jgi:hypothetical protein
MRLRSAARSTLGAVTGLLLISARTYADDRQIRPFIGAALGGTTTFVDPERVFGKRNLVIGASAVFLGEMFGVEIDFADAPAYFESGDNTLVRGSRVTTFTGNFVVAAPRRLTEYSLRPYLVAGGGLMRVKTTTTFNVFDISAVVPAFDVGVGLLGFVTNRTGVSWDVRRFQTFSSNPGETGLSFGREYMSFWRASMAVAIRY